MKWFWRQYLKLSGWDTGISFPYSDLQKFVIIVAPHTSNWDFIIGLAYRSILGLTNTRFLGKSELFRPPFGLLFKRLGGISVDRKNSQQLVSEVAKQFHQYSDFRLALSPEGTRSRVTKLRTGFYFIAKEANVPIIMVGLDWKNKTVLFSNPLVPVNFDQDIQTIISFYKPIAGKYPDQGIV